MKRLRVRALFGQLAGHFRTTRNEDVSQRPPGGRTGQRRRLPYIVLLAVTALVAGVVALPALGNHAFVTVTDVDGANDEPGQKDLTKLQVDDTHAGVLYVNWNWDELTGFSGANTGDACALLDTDQDGLVNFALCVTIQDNVSGVPVQTSASPRLYKCDESPASVANRRCTSSMLLGDANSNGVPDPGAYQSSCTITSPSGDDPFAAGDDYPDDTKASCIFNFTDLALSGPGAPTSGTLLNVCSYPSQQPNSDPSDCVVTPGAGFITIVKVASPNDGTTQFNFTLNPAALGGTSSFSTTGSGSVELIPVSPGTNYSITEAVPANWSLTSASCTVNGSATGTFNGTTAMTSIHVLTGQETVCTFNDTLQQGKLEVVKDLIPSGDGGKFNLRSTAPPTRTPRTWVTADRPARRPSTPATTRWARRRAPPPPSADYQKSIVCKGSNGTGSVVAQTSGDSAGPLTVNVTSNADIVCTITNTRETGKLEVVKDLIPSGDPGMFNLQIDGNTDRRARTSATAARPARRRSTPARTTWVRRPAPATDLADYQKSISCMDTANGNAAVASHDRRQRRAA